MPVFPLAPDGQFALPLVPRRVPLVPAPLRAALRACLSGSAPWPLYCWGPPGVGKTCAALLACDFTRGRYCTLSDLVARESGPRGARGSWGLATAPDDDPWLGCAASPFAALDEVGCAGLHSESAYASLLRWLELRFTRHGAVALLVGNLPPAQLLGVYDARIVDRLTAGTVVEVPHAAR